MRAFPIAILLAATATAGIAQDVALSPDRPGRAVLSETPKRPLTDPQSLVSEARAGAQPVPLADAMSLRSSWFAAWTPDGRDIVMSTDLTGRVNLWRTSSSGGFPEQLQQSDDKAFYPAVSPDGQMVLFASDVGGREIFDIFSVPLEGGATVNLTATPDASDTGPFVFSADSRNVLFNRRVATEPSTNVAMLTLDGRKVRLLTREKQPGIYWRAVGFLPGGKRVIANRSDLTNSTIWSIDVETGSMARVAGSDKGYDEAAAISPDGRFLSATSENGAGVREAVLIDIATGTRTVMAPGS